MSAKFTGFDEFQTGQGLCISCAWAFSTAARRLTLNITPTGATLLDTPALYDRLLRPSDSAALVVPLSGRKHVLPYARWGTVRIDDINIVWRSSDVGRLKLVAELRAHTGHSPGQNTQTSTLASAPSPAEVVADRRSGECSVPLEAATSLPRRP